MGFVDVLGPAGAAADEHQPVAIDHGHAGAGAIGKFFETGHVQLCPRNRDKFKSGRLGSGRLRLHRHHGDRHQHEAAAFQRSWPSPRCASIVPGSAMAKPTALPLSRAAISSRASARSISTGVGTASITISALANGRLWLPAICPATLRGEDAVVDEDQPALGGFAQHRRQRLFRRGEPRAHVVCRRRHNPASGSSAIAGDRRSVRRKVSSAASADRDRCRDNRTAPSAPAAALRGLALALASPAGRRRRRRARTRSVTAPGNFSIASAVAVALMPRPPTMIAMRGASALSGGSLTGRA